ncbi:MAG: SIS domain-containing protein [Candidatus Dadabacteria bacterium]|nr:MAG: SIS domain-containing protein [Candidatus Dadabacteria bacterium]
MRDIITAHIERSLRVKQDALKNQELLNNIEQCAERLLSCIKDNGTVYIAGNGGSACDSLHFCEELVARYKRERPGIKAHHLIDPAILTCWSNDYSYDLVFQRQVETFCTEKDLLFLLSTSGNSQNVIKAAETAKDKGTAVIALTGESGGALAPLADIALKVPSNHTAHIQEMHITILHLLCEIVEQELFES